MKRRKPNINVLKGIIEDRANAMAYLPLAAAIILVVVVGAFFIDRFKREIPKEPVILPDFASIGDIKERKAAFFEFLLPFIEEANAAILEEREEVKVLQERFSKKGSLKSSQLKTLRTLEIRYEFDPDDTVDEQTFLDLLSRVDALPPSLALAQSAIESAWGSSRFAREGNNLFGMWCYQPGCGIVPRRRPQGRTYEVAKYDSPGDSFRAYFMNLNTNQHYYSMRAIRRALRRQGLPLNGYDLADGLDRYSEEGYIYVGKVQGFISSNGLKRFDSDK